MQWKIIVFMKWFLFITELLYPDFETVKAFGFDMLLHRQCNTNSPVIPFIL